MSLPRHIRGGARIVTEFNILIAGVGGQGVILLSELLGDAAVADGLNVRGSEILGMAVRGGPVVSIVRIGSDVHGPLIPQGKGDILIGLEPSEALRNVTYLAKSGVILLNSECVVPFTVSLGECRYPGTDEIVAGLKLVTDRVVALDAGKLAREAGSALAANVVMLGASFGTGLMPIKRETIESAIRDHFPAKAVSVNLRAFERGFAAYQA